jgi:hypothetical protein
MTIERLDTSVMRSRPPGRELENRLLGLAAAIGNTALSFVNHVEELRAEGYVNRLKIMDTPGGLQGQFYYEGAYELAPDEALIVESQVPRTCLYWSTILTNDIYETTDWVNNQSSLNDSQARVDSDGVVRFVVSLQDPGIPNWLDAAGYPTGAIQGRWTECDGTPIPKVTKVHLADLRKVLPSETPVVTPSQREAIIRERRAHFLSRTMW